jgi:uncharacterized protein
VLALARSPVVSLLAVAAALTACGSDQTSAGTRTVSVGNGTVRADVADSTGERDKGLSGRASLSDREGMLFIFPNRAPRSFWMKGMRFPIDIVWIAHGRVIGVTRNVPVPRAGLPTYDSPGPAGQVLEVRAGWAARHHVRRGGGVTITG